MTRRITTMIGLTAALLTVFAMATASAIDTTQSTPTPAPKLAITFVSKPSPPVTGDNAFEVTVKDAKGAPIADADVSVAFHMAAMPSMNMPAMDTEVKLKAAGGGTYRGNGQVMMAGTWDVTVRVKQGGKEIGKKQIKVTAK